MTFSSSLRAFVATAAIFVSTSAFAATVGQPAPDFKVKDITGKEQSVSQYKGKTVVLEWNNPECPFVKKWYDQGDMQKLQAEMKKDGVVWLAVNSGAEGKQGHMSAEEALKVTQEKNFAGDAYILDAEGTIGHSYGAKTTPHMYVVDKEGTLVYAGAIDDKPSTKSADIATAKNYVREAVAALKAGKPVKVASTQAYGCAVKYEK